MRNLIKWNSFKTDEVMTVTLESQYMKTQADRQKENEIEKILTEERTLSLLMKFRKLVLSRV